MRCQWLNGNAGQCKNKAEAQFCIHDDNGENWYGIWLCKKHKNTNDYLKVWQKM